MRTAHVGLPYVVARGFGPHGVFSGQSDAAHGDDQQDAHLEIAQGADVVARPTEPGCTQEQICFSYLASAKCMTTMCVYIYIHIYTRVDAKLRNFLNVPH